MSKFDVLSYNRYLKDELKNKSIVRYELTLHSDEKKTKTLACEKTSNSSMGVITQIFFDKYILSWS